ncbi:MAG: nucleotide exchange factor GrpE [Syntrophomonadaceae bacterium]|jgi:molecular chaperone GrpE
MEDVTNHETEDLKENTNANIDCQPEVQGDDPDRDEVTALNLKLEKLQEEAKRNYDQYLRALAEVENIRKRSQREREDYIKYASLPVIKKLLPVLDDLERAVNMSTSSDYDSLYKGVKMITDRLRELLKGEGVETIDCLGKPFDPQVHQPLMVEPSEDYEPNIVMEELQKGYIMKGKLVRPSLVKVSG